jgi:ATP-dependent DNA helicase MPH1
MDFDDYDEFDDEVFDEILAKPKTPNVTVEIAGPPSKRRKLDNGAPQQRPGPSEDQIRILTSDIDIEDFEADFQKENAAPKSPLIIRNQPDKYDFDKELEDIASDAFNTSPSLVISNHAQVTKQKQLTIANHNLSHQAPKAPLENLRQTTLFGRNASNEDNADKSAVHRRNWPLANVVESPTHHELDLEAAKTWVYPLNLGKIRDYQYNIVSRGLFHNTLVALPTGLGKTFIAATVILNWFRWTKDAKMVFVAPTKPLVQQQIHACANITGIPYSQCAVLTGENKKSVRQDEWESKRVFFMTPQTLEGDLSAGYADPKKIVLLIVDEAHKAIGNYSYVKIASKIRLHNTSFRVLALTATPGANVDAVQQVIDNLHISRVEIRNENSMDLREHVHDRDVQTEVFKRSDEMAQIMDLYSKAAKPLIDSIENQLPSYMRDPLSLTPFGCNQAMRDWHKSGAAQNAHPSVKGRIMVILGLLGGLAHGMDLLKFHSVTAAFQKWREFKEESTSNEKAKSKSVWKEKLFGSEYFQLMMDKLDLWCRDPEFIGHPKLEYLREVVLNHLLDHEEKKKRHPEVIGQTGIMVFASFRGSAEVIAQCLERTNPLIKPHVFVGQSDSKTSKGMTQKKQLEVIDQFKKGKYNVLIATSIGEEGLDIGEVDLIVCYDSKASPLRMLQRMGRTGRKRAGRVVLLQMQGKEENDWAKAKDSYQTMQKKITNGNDFNFHEDRSRRILPREIQPFVDKRLVEIPVENSQITPGQLIALPKKGSRKVKKNFHMPDGVETGFVNAANVGKSKGRPKKTAIAPVVANEDPEPIPYLDTVCLSDHQQTMLETNYQNFHFGDDNEDNQLSGPMMNRFPDLQRIEGPTAFVTHGQSTKRLVRALQKVAVMDDYTVSEFEMLFDQKDLEDGTDLESILVSNTETQLAEIIQKSPLIVRTKAKRGPKKQAAPLKAPGRTKAHIPITRNKRVVQVNDSLEAGEGDESSPPSSDPLYARHVRAISLGSQDTPPPSTANRATQFGDTLDSSMAAFIVSDEEVIAELEAQEALLDSTLNSVLNLQDSAGYRKEKRFRLSSDIAVGSDDSLPDLDELLNRNKKVRPVSKSKLKPNRRVVEDSDDDD